MRTGESFADLLLQRVFTGAIVGEDPQLIVNALQRIALRITFAEFQRECNSPETEPIDKQLGGCGPAIVTADQLCTSSLPGSQGWSAGITALAILGWT